MSKCELDKILAADKETEHLEFKEMSGIISILGKDKGKGETQKRSLYGYCVAIGNEDGGKLILGVKDSINPTTGMRDIVGTNALPNIQKAKEQIFDILGRRIEIEEIETENGKVQIVLIPSHPVGEPFEFYGTPLMRNGERLERMDKGTLRAILNEGQNDFSALKNSQATWDDLDQAAIELLKKKWIEKSGNEELEKFDNREILEKLLLLTSGKITNACLLLVGKKEALTRLLPNSEIFLEWRLGDRQDDYDMREILGEPYIIAQDKIWNFVNSRNTRVPFKSGFFELDIWAYNEQSIRESVSNAFAHREYFNRTEPIYVRVSPEKVTVKSPGGFVSGVTVENVLDVEGKWRNHFLMNVLERVGLVERAGTGLDKIYKTAISQGKGFPDFDGTTSEYVILNIPAKIIDINFVYYLQKIEREKQIQIDTLKDFMELEKIRETGKATSSDRLQFFIENGLIEKVGKGRGLKYMLAKNFYEFIDSRSEYTRKKWLSKEQQKEVLLSFFRQHEKGKMSDFAALFENKLSSKQIFIMLDELRQADQIYFDGKRRSSKDFWRKKN